SEASPPTSPSSRPDPPPTAPSPSPITLPKRRNRRESELPDFVNGLLGAVAPICGPLLRPLRVAAIAAGLGLAPCAAVAQEFVELPQSIVPFGPGVTVVGPASPDAPVHFQLALKLRNFSELQDRLAAGQQVAYPELEQQFLPTAQDYGSVVAWLRGEGLTIERTARDRMTVAAGGAVASVSRALGISFMHIISEGQEYVSANSAPKAPAALSGIVASVNGLQPQLHMNKLSILSPQATPGFSPAGIRDAYAATGLSETGANTTTAIIIDTFPNRSDLTTFWNEGLVPQLQSNITFIQAVPGTLPAPSGEESIDTEWASSIAPGSKVRVYAYGNTATNAAFFTDVDNGYEAIILDLANGVKITQVSISLGICETLVPQGQFLTDEYFHAILTSLGATVLVATGDNGSTGCFRFTKSLAKVAEFPSTSPDVTAVGGTTLVLNSNGSVASETAWSGDGASGGSGGGLSVAFKTPSYQSSLGLPSRGVPDVAADANPATGVAIVLNGKVVVFGGTSVATPIWAGLMGLVNQARLAAGKSTLGLLNQRLYRPVPEAAFRDITVGNNGFPALVGYDLVTGWGAPRMNILLPDLKAQTP
ncbi:MAG TPA: S53 family peptidase, partial [Opitutaceae bacterium]|nr:S53 family peptidase [Opitutaceae bacterium]